MQIRPRRSALYMPGSNLRAMAKAKQIPVDAIILDLEDSVAPDAKNAARTQTSDTVKAGGFGKREVVIRINSLSTPWGKADLAVAIASGCDAILIPKVSTPGDMAPIQDEITRAGSNADIWAMMETPLAIINAAAIAGAKSDKVPSLSVLVMGTNDLAKETRARPAPGRINMLPWLANCVAAARSFGLQIIDGVYNQLEDEAGFFAECEQGRDLGMDGKTLIHPRQVAPCNGAFSPLAEEVSWARRVCAAFDAPENRDVGVLRIDGQMVERLHAEMARHVLATEKLLKP